MLTVAFCGNAMQASSYMHVRASAPAGCGTTMATEPGVINFIAVALVCGFESPRRSRMLEILHPQCSPESANLRQLGTLSTDSWPTSGTGIAAEIGRYVAANIMHSL